MVGKSKWTGWHMFVLLTSIIAIVVIVLLVPVQRRLWAWLAILILPTVFITTAEHGITGLWRGLLIGERNKISLSRLQMIIGTIVVLSGFLVAALSNLAAGQTSHFSIAIPTELWLLM